MKTTFLILLLTVCVSAWAQKANDPMLVQNLNALDWKPKKTLPPGAMSAVAYGDPAKGNYDFFGKFPSQYSVPTHWHSFDCMVVMVKGSMIIKRDEVADVTIRQGGFFMLPAEMKYTAHCPTECIFLVHGEKPFDIFYANPKDDPRSATQKGGEQ